MKPNPILEETWRIKEQIAREAGYDLEKLCAQTRQWAFANLHSPPWTPLTKNDALQAELRENSNPPN